MLLSKGKITKDLVDMMMSWRHSGFNVFCGPRIQPGDIKAGDEIGTHASKAVRDALGTSVKGAKEVIKSLLI